MSRRVFFRDSEAQGFSTYGLLLDTLFRQLKTVGISQYFPYEYREDMSCGYAELVSFFGEAFGKLAEQEGDASNLSILSKHVSLRGILLERYRKDNEKYLAAVNSLSIGSLKRVVEVDEPSWDKLYASAEEEDTEEEYQEGIKASSEGKSTSAAMNSFLAAINGTHAVDDSVAPAYVEGDVDEPVGGSFSNEDYSWEEEKGILPDDDEEEGEDEWEGSDTLPEDDEDAWEGSDTLPEDEDEEEENEGVLPDDEDEGGVVALPVELPVDEDSGVLPDDDEKDYSSELLEDDDEEDYSSELPEDDDEEDLSSELPEDDDEEDYSSELLEDDDEEDYSSELLEDDDEEDYSSELLEDDDEEDLGVLPNDEEDYSTELPDDEDNVDTVKPKAYTVPTSVVSYSTNIPPAPAMVVHPSYARGIPGRETQEAVLDMMNKLANNIKGWFSRL